MFKILFLILILISPTIFAQQSENDEQNEKPKAYLFDEFGEISRKEIKLRTEKLRKKLQEPDAKNGGFGAYLIFYSDDKEESLPNTETFIRNVLFDNCRDCYGYNGPRIVFIQGGKAETQKVQFWIVPAGAEPPDVLKSEKPNVSPQAKKMDDFGKVSDDELKND